MLWVCGHYTCFTLSVDASLSGTLSFGIWSWCQMRIDSQRIQGYLVTNRINKMKWLGFRPPLCTYMLKWEHPEDGEMNEMTLPSRHWMQNSGRGGLRPSTLPSCHGDSQQYWMFTSEQKHFERPSHSSHHPQKVLLAQFSLYVHKGGLKHHSFSLHFHYVQIGTNPCIIIYYKSRPICHYR